MVRCILHPHIQLYSFNSKFLLLTCDWEGKWTKACMRAMPSASRMSQAIGKTTGRRGRATATVCSRNISVQWPTPTHLPRYKKRMRLTNSTHTCSNKKYNMKTLLGGTFSLVDMCGCFARTARLHHHSRRIYLPQWWTQMFHLKYCISTSDMVLHHMKTWNLTRI